MEGQLGLSELSVISWVSVKWGSTVYILINYHNICRDVIRNVSSGFQKPSSVKVQITPQVKRKKIYIYIHICSIVMNK